MARLCALLAALHVATSHAMSVGPTKVPQRFGAQVLYMELPMRDGFLHRHAPRSVVPPGLRLDKRRPVRLWVAYYPNANMSWVGDPASSEMQSVPHHELNIQLPVTFKGQEFYHSVYALTDDDVAMLHYRDAQGTPAKLADFEFAGDLGSWTSRFRVARRGEEVINVHGARGKAVDTSTGELQGLFDNTLNIFGTQALMPGRVPLYGRNPSNSVFLSMRASTAVSKAWEFNVDSVSIPKNVHERISKFFNMRSELRPVRALWMQADVGCDSDPAPSIVSAVGTGMADMSYFLSTFMLKLGGAQVDAGVPGKRHNPFEWQNGRFIWFSVKVKPEVAQKQLPPGTTLADDKAHIFCANYPTAMLYATMGSFDKSVGKDNFPYHEFGIRLQAKMPNGDVFHHVTYILVDDDVPLMTGRDMLGTPKKMMTKVEFPADEDLHAGSTVRLYIERRGQPVINFTGRIGDKTPRKPAPGLTDGVLDVSVYSNEYPTYFDDTVPKKAKGPVYVQWFGSHKIHENRAMEQSDVTFGASASEPLNDWLVSGEPLDAGFMRMDYGKKNDLKSRPTIGEMSMGEPAVNYWRDTFQSHFGGAPFDAHSDAIVTV